MPDSENNMKPIGNYFYTPGGNVYYNMAFDEWLFGAVIGHKLASSALLRLYSWNKPGITIGYNQKVEKALDQSRLNPEVPVVRRITGGRAIYHDPGEITFSLSLDINLLATEARSLSAVNTMISMTVVNILKRKNIDAEWSRYNSGTFLSGQAKSETACFDSVSRYEITANGQKIAGGAQRRIGSALIHQGSIKINGITDAPAVGQRGDRGFQSGINIRGKAFTIADFRGEFQNEFSKSLGIEFNESALFEEHLADLSECAFNVSKNPLEKREIV